MVIEVTLSKDRGYNITAICCSTYYMMLDAAVKLPKYLAYLHAYTHYPKHRYRILVNLTRPQNLPTP